MSRSLTIWYAAAVLLFLAIGPQEAVAADVPPVAQPLVREGDFAVRLSAVYGLGEPSGETEAEDLLASAGIVPLNGWITDYPVTPDILGQLRDSARRAASEGRLQMTADTAVQLLYDLASGMGIPLPADAAPPAAQTSPGPYEQTVINGHYSGYGPPIITYYPPPPSYLYLYAWVPFPVWWYGYWYPGYYIINDFSTTIVVGSRRVAVRNRFVDPVTRQVVRVDPVVRTSRDGVRAQTMLRTDDGRTFRSMRDLRQGVGTARPSRGRDGTLSRRPPGTTGGPASLGERRGERQKGSEGQGAGRPASKDLKPGGRSPGSGGKPAMTPPAGGAMTRPPGSGQRLDRPGRDRDVRPGMQDRPSRDGSFGPRPGRENSAPPGPPRQRDGGWGPGPGWGNDRTPGQRR